MKFDKIRVYNFEGALADAMRNPKLSWDRSDSSFGLDTMENVENRINSLYSTKEEATAHYKDHILYQNNDLCEYAFLGENDLKLAKSLIRGGSEHRKFMRQIVVNLNITAPLYW